MQFQPLLHLHPLKKDLKIIKLGTFKAFYYHLNAKILCYKNGYKNNDNITLSQYNFFFVTHIVLFKDNVTVHLSNYLS